jgi:lysophospholipase L1-like esterase
MYSPYSSRRQFIQRGIAALTLPLTIPLSLKAKEHNAEEFTILFQGDSITDGNRGRNDDPNHILGHGYAFAVASDLGSRFPGRNLKFINKGVSGDKVSDLLLRWENDCILLRPDVVSILAGINDILAAIGGTKTFEIRKFHDQVGELVTLTRKSLPNALLVVGEPFILPVGMVTKNPEHWSEMVTGAQRILKDLAKEYNAVHVPYQSAFTDACKKAEAPYWIWDGIHPTYAGHGLMKDLWIDTVRKRCAKIS